MCNKEEVMKMQKIQNRAMRIILNCEYFTPVEFMLGALNWLSIAQMIRFSVVLYIHKILNGLLPNYLSENLIFSRNIHSRNTRKNINNNLRLPNYRLQTSRKSLYYNGILLYNSLPSDIKSEASINSFKEKCKMYIMRNTGIN